MIPELQSLEGVRVTVVGDFMLDRYTWGEAERISPEAPVVVVRVREEEWRLGGAGNVVSNLAQVGAHPVAVGVIGGDDAGRQLKDLLEKQGADVSGLVEDSSRQTTSKNRIVANSQQVVRIDHEDVDQLSDVLKAKLLSQLEGGIQDTQGYIVSDYGKGVWGEKLWKFLVADKKEQPVIVDPKPINRNIYKGADLLTPNRTEAEMLSGITIRDVDEAVEAGRLILSNLELGACLVTLGSQGMLLVRADNSFTHIPTEARKVFDVSGAGDTVIALMGLGISAGWKVQESARLANLAAGIVVEEVGTVPVSLKKLEDRLASLSLEG